MAIDFEHRVYELDEAELMGNNSDLESNPFLRGLFLFKYNDELDTSVPKSVEDVLGVIPIALVQCRVSAVWGHKPRTVQLWRGDEIISSACWSTERVRPNETRISYVVVQRKFRGQGFGRALIRTVETDITSSFNEAVLIAISSNQTDEATTLYERCGYERDQPQSFEFSKLVSS